MASPVLAVPTSPSIFDRNLPSLNSWAARSFTTLQPSDSPSQALFPKHSQASLLLAARIDNTHTIGALQGPPTVTQHSRQLSFAKRNLCFILFTALLHISIILLSVMLVLVITATTSNPRKHINPSYYVGIMLSVAAGTISAILIYNKYNERSRTLLSEALQSPTSPTHNIELGHLPPPMTTFHGVVSNWEEPLSRHPLRSIMVSRNPLTTASARIAGSINRPHVLDDINLPPSLLPYAQHQQNHDSTSTAAALQRFLEHELQRQQAIKRRISAWLHGVIPLPSPPNHPPPAQPPSISTPHASPIEPRTPRDPVRLAELNKEIEIYLGFPAPPLPGEGNPYKQWGVEDEQAVSSEGGSIREAGTEKQDEETKTETGIDYSTLPPAIPRLGARGRDPMLSDPITVVHVGPMREVVGNGQRGSRMKEEELRDLGNGDGVGVGVVQGREERDSFAERWLGKVVRGVDVERRVGPAVAGGRRTGKEKGGRRWKDWIWLGIGRFV
ncbi:MAG: hypothetical protein Q9178_002125 [Gyalolechia marmorata]